MIESLEKTIPQVDINVWSYSNHGYDILWAWSYYSLFWGFSIPTTIVDSSNFHVVGIVFNHIQINDFLYWKRGTNHFQSLSCEKEYSLVWGTCRFSQINISLYFNNVTSHMSTNVLFQHNSFNKCHPINYFTYILFDDSYLFIFDSWLYCLDTY